MRKAILPTVLCLAMMGLLALLSSFEPLSGQLLYSLIGGVMFMLSGLVLKKLSPSDPFKRFFCIKRLLLRNFFLVFWSTLTIVLGSFLLNFLTSFVCDLLHIEAESSLVYGFSSGNIIVTLVTLALIPAVTEELFFRGAVMSFLKEKGVAFSVFVSAALFTLMHGLDVYFLSTFFAGVMLAYVAYLTENIISSAIIHFINNFMSYILILYAEKLAIVRMDIAMMWTALLLFIVSAVVLLSIIIRRLKKEDRQSVPKEGEKKWEENQPQED